MKEPSCIFASEHVREIVIYCIYFQVEVQCNRLVFIMFSSGLKHTLKWVHACDAERKVLSLSGVPGYLHVGDTEQMLVKLTAEM